MSNEQSIRDELAQVIFERSHTPNDALNLWDGDINKIVDALLASPVIRRIQAEGLREAEQELRQEREPLPEYVEVGHPSGERQPVEPQGEPSDAQVVAALNAYQDRRRLGSSLGDWGSFKVERMRAALRAAYEERESR